ncbi:restriction endonuclease subunit S [Parasphingorhabdus sp. NYA22]
MTGHKGYADYINAKAPWIDKIPSTWSDKPLFSVAAERNTKNIGMIEKNLLSLSYGRVIKKNIDTTTGLLPASFETYQIVEQNDVIFRLTDLQNDKRSLRSAICRERGIITSAYIAVNPKSVNPKFFDYLMRSYDIQKVFYSMGGGMRQSLTFSDIRRMQLACPSSEDQQTIANFLDRETCRIDTLIEKKTRFIKLLKEKRAAMITHAVTMGIQADVKTGHIKKSWIDRIPPDWQVTRLRYIASVLNSNVDKKSYADQLNVGLCNYTDVYYNDFITSSIPFMKATATKAEIASFQLQKGDVIITKDSESPSDIGIPAFVEESIPGIVCGYHLSVIRSRSESLSAFIFYTIQSHQNKAHFYVETPGITRYGLNQNSIKNIKICLPPQDEMQSIVKFLFKETSKADLLLSKIQVSISLLKERRSALITAAVTGKIDVRNEV